MRNDFIERFWVRGIIAVLVFTQVFFSFASPARAEWYDGVSTVIMDAVNKVTENATITLPIVGEVGAGTTAVVTAVTVTAIGSILAMTGFDNGAVGDQSGSGGNLTQQLEDRYGIDKSTIQDYSQELNVSNQKGEGPQVTLVFNPSTPKLGEEVTAMATPVMFSTSADKLYYTWYLKRKDCDTDGNFHKAVDKNNPAQGACDMDGDGYITPNDWKIAAMKLVALGGYEPNSKNADGTVNENHNPSTSTTGDDDGYKATFGGDGNVATNKFCYVHDYSSGKNYELSSGVVSGDGNSPETASYCGVNSGRYLKNHLFPHFQDYTTGDGDFGGAEEAKWGTDPHNPSTAQNGNKDEANVVGFGIQSFKWVYAPGDEVGVAVEGETIYPTKHPDASQMIMWAFPKNQCFASIPGSLNPSVYAATISKQQVSIPYVSMDEEAFDRCFKDNLIDPTQGGQPKNMEITVSSMPENPVAQIVDTSNANPQGDTVNVQAVTTDSTSDPSTIWYQWDVRVSKDGTFATNFDDANQWEELTTDADFQKLLSKVEGNGVKSLNMTLNLPASFKTNHPGVFNDKTGAGYFLVKVTARENFQQDTGRGGRASTVIKVTLAGNQIRVYTVKTADTSGVTRVGIGSEICINGVSQAVCKVLPNQIIGLTVPKDFTYYDSYQWTINSKTLECDTSISTECKDNVQSAEAFFPVLGATGEQYVVSLTATNSQSGDAVTLSRNFIIVEPQVDIEPVTANDSKTVWQKLLGYYQGVDGSQLPDYSDSVYETNTGQTITLQPIFNASNLQGNAQMAWLVDGATPDGIDATTGVLAFQAAKPAGQEYSVQLKGIYYQPQEIRKALYDIWGVSPNTSVESSFEKSIQVEIGVNEDESASITTGFLSKPIRYFGALISYMPGSILFAIRLAFTLALALFSIGFILSFFPEASRPKS